MTDRRRPSVLYVVPGHDFLPTAGPTRNVLNQARAMTAWADVRLAFRRMAATPGPSDPPVVEIEPRSRADAASVEDAGTTGMSYVGFARYLRAIRHFVASEASGVDMILEKDWMLTGLVSGQCLDRGVTSIPVKNWIAGGGPTAGGFGPKAARHALGAWVEGRMLRRLPCVVAETDFLKRAMVDRWHLAPERVEVVGLGIDRELFHPADPDRARERIGIPLEATVLLYSGILDRTHDLEPALRALTRVAPAGVRLHAIGDGPRREEYESLAATSGGAVVLHGRVPHEEVPDYIAAADLCVAPYDPAAFAGGEVAYSTLKVREYLSAGRPVVTMPSGSLKDLVRHGASGFFVENRVEDWTAFLERLPPRDRLRSMDAAAAATELESWDDISAAFRKLWLRTSGAGVGHRAGGRPVTNESR